MKAKALLLTLFLSVVAVSLWAQETYELAVVTHGYVGAKAVIRITTSSEVKIVDVPKDADLEGKQLKEVEVLLAQGWEIYNTTVTSTERGGPGYHYFYLRKKKN